MATTTNSQAQNGYYPNELILFWIVMWATINAPIPVHSTDRFAYYG